MSDNADVKTQLKEFDDTEFAIMFIDNICKKLKSLDKPDMRSNTLLFMYMSVIDSIKRYCELATETNHNIPHKDAIDVIIRKGESYLSSVADFDFKSEDDFYKSKALYVEQEISNLHDLVKDLLFVLKKDLVNTPKYAHLKPGCAYK